jgi:PAS domain S-box-containing protein
MKKPPAYDSKSKPDEIAAVLRTLHPTQRRPKPISDGAPAAVLPQSTPAYLLHEVQEKLRRSEEQFRNMFTSAAIGIAISTPQGRFLHVNAAYCNMLGYTEQELLQFNFADLTHPEDLHLNLEMRDDLLAGRRDSFIIEKRYFKKTGEIVWTRHSVSATHTGTSEIASLLVVAEEITERKRVEAELHRKQARYQRLVDSNIQGVIFWDRNGTVTGANDAFLRLVHHTREDLEAGRIDWIALTPPEYGPADLRSLEEIDANGISTPYEKEFFRKDGTRVPVLLGAAAFDDDPNQGVCFILDLTDRKKLEQQFFRAQRLESIGTLAGGIAHDLNNILAPIMISADLLRPSLQDADSTALLETIGLSARRGADIVGQILSFTRGVKSERVEFQLNPLLHDLEKILKDTFPKDIHLNFRIPTDAWPLFADPTQVHQVLLNLCVNARDAMPHGGDLSLNVENCLLDEHSSNGNSQKRTGRYLQIAVTDSGVGMSAKVLDRIFDPFFTTKDLNKGTGLGLSTVMAIVKSHDGIVNVYSEPGNGTTFNVYLPAAAISSTVLKPPPGSAAAMRGNGETILLVDDESSIIGTIGKALETCGYRILTAGDGAEGVAVYAGNMHSIAVVLTDLTMPVMGGVAMIHALKTINPRIKVIAASGLNGSAGHGSIPGVRHFLPKPYSLNTLLGTLRTVLDEA